jgi:hypothetical protein
VLDNPRSWFTMSFADYGDDKPSLCNVFRYNVKGSSIEGEKSPESRRNRHNAWQQARGPHDIIYVNASLPLLEEALLRVGCDDDPHDQLYSNDS